MSMNRPALAIPATVAPKSPASPRPLRLVESGARRHTRRGLLYALSTLGLVGVLVATQLFLSVVLSQGAYELRSLTLQDKEASRALQVAQVALQQAKAPQALADAAAGLGMVTAGAPVYLRLSDDALIGAPTAAHAGDSAPNLVPNALLATSQTAAATEEADAATQPDPGEAIAMMEAGLVPWQGELPAPVTR